LPCNSKRNIEVCFSPALTGHYGITEKNVVLIDILRATSTICTAFAWGVKEIIPVASEEEALAYKAKGFIVAGERDGKVLIFADFGNSPFDFMNDKIKDNSVVFCTTNGTKAINAAKNAEQLIIGSYLNFSSLANYLENDNHDVVLLCSGWKNKFSIEDTLFAGALCHRLITGEFFETDDDAAIVAVDLWNNTKYDLLSYVDKGDHSRRLKKLGYDGDIEFCHTFDKTDKLPVLSGETIINL